jgi:hypothetical protein
VSTVMRRLGAPRCAMVPRVSPEAARPYIKPCGHLYELCALNGKLGAFFQLDRRASYVDSDACGCDPCMPPQRRGSVLVLGSIQSQRRRGARRALDASHRSSSHAGGAHAAAPTLNQKNMAPKPARAATMPPPRAPAAEPTPAHPSKTPCIVAAVPGGAMAPQCTTLAA